MNNTEIKEIIRKWYGRLGFPRDFDAEFYRALDETEIDCAPRFEDYDNSSGDGKKNLLCYLYFCEETERRYKALGISEKIMLDTMQDIVIYTDVWTREVVGELYLGQLDWVRRVHDITLFRLGRLQFGFGKSTRDDPESGLTRGEGILEIHIPRGAPLTEEECRLSLDMAREFFEKYFTEYNYRFFTCASWLLGKELLEGLSPESNIVKFGKMFKILDSKSNGDGGLKYVFGWSATRESVKAIREKPKSSLARLLKEKVDLGEPITSGFGYIVK